MRALKILPQKKKDRQGKCGKILIIVELDDGYILYYSLSPILFIEFFVLKKIVEGIPLLSSV